MRLASHDRFVFFPKEIPHKEWIKRTENKKKKTFPFFFLLSFLLNKIQWKKRRNSNENKRILKHAPPRILGNPLKSWAQRRNEIFCRRRRQRASRPKRKSHRRIPYPTPPPTTPLIPTPSQKRSCKRLNCIDSLQGILADESCCSTRRNKLKKKNWTGWNRLKSDEIGWNEIGNGRGMLSKRKNKTKSNKQIEKWPVKCEAWRRRDSNRAGRKWAGERGRSGGPAASRGWSGRTARGNGPWWRPGRCRRRSTAAAASCPMTAAGSTKRSCCWFAAGCTAGSKASTDPGSSPIIGPPLQLNNNSVNVSIAIESLLDPHRSCVSCQRINEQPHGIIRIELNIRRFFCFHLIFRCWKETGWKSFKILWDSSAS